MLTSPQLVRAQALHRQISDHVRELIFSGELASETRLPPTNELAVRWRTTPMTMQKALTTLVKEGLLTRVPKRGTFVRNRGEKLICVGVFARVTGGESRYVQALHNALKQELRRLGIEMDLWFDPRPEEQYAEPWPPFVHAATHREFQAVIVTLSSHRHLPWQTKLPVPVAFHNVASLPNAATWDLEQLADRSLEALSRQGCRSVGVICSAGVAAPKFCRRLSERIGELGLTIKNEWLRLPPAALVLTGGAVQEQFGHEEFLRLWAQPARPQGLIVFPDTAAQGVILGLLEKQVRVPADLKLVLHKNEGVDLYCPMPATFIVGSERKLAQALINQVQKLFQGQPCEPIEVPFALRAHPGSCERQTINQDFR